MKNFDLTHHGIKGMKWGIRRYQNEDGGLTIAGQKHLTKNTDKKARKARKQDAKNRRTLSLDDIKKKIDRLKLEKELKSLTEEDIAPGKKFVSESVKSAGKKVFTVAASGTMAYAVKAAMTRQFDIKEAAAYVAANPNKKK